MNLEGSESIQPDAKTKSEKQVEGGIIIKRKERRRERERERGNQTSQLFNFRNGCCWYEAANYKKENIEDKQTTSNRKEDERERERR